MNRTKHISTRSIGSFVDRVNVAWKIEGVSANTATHFRLITQNAAHRNGIEIGIIAFQRLQIENLHELTHIRPMYIALVEVWRICDAFSCTRQPLFGLRKNGGETSNLVIFNRYIATGRLYAIPE